MGIFSVASSHVSARRIGCMKKITFRGKKILRILGSTTRLYAHCVPCGLCRRERSSSNLYVIFIFIRFKKTEMPNWNILYTYILYCRYEPRTKPTRNKITSPAECAAVPNPPWCVLRIRCSRVSHHWIQTVFVLDRQRLKSLLIFSWTPGREATYRWTTCTVHIIRVWLW